MDAEMEFDSGLAPVPNQHVSEQPQMRAAPEDGKRLLYVIGWTLCTTPLSCLDG
jgi:hypothetical protein